MWFARKRQPPNITSLHLKDESYQRCSQHDNDTMRAWISPNGDLVTLNFFEIPPDLPSTSKRDDLKAFYASQLDDVHGELLELELLSINGLASIRMLCVLSQEPSGRTYIGSITIPRKQCSYVIKCTCLECETTGLKETILLDRFFESNKHPSDHDLQAQMSTLNAPDHDEEFPDHPVARARRTLRHLASILVIDQDVLRLPPFPLPSVDNPR